MNRTTTLLKSLFSIAFGLFVLGGLAWLTYFLMSRAWLAFASLNPTVAVALVTASATVLASTVTVMVGRYLERRRELESAYRARKTEMYDAFIKRFLEQFQSDENEAAAPGGGSKPTEDGESEAAELGDESESTEDLVPFLRESQRRFLLWSGPRVIRRWVEWSTAIKTEPTKAKTFLKMEKLFLAIRHDLGHSNRGLQDGDFVSFIIRHNTLFMRQLKKNPEITMQELAELEKRLSGGT